MGGSRPTIRRPNGLYCVLILIATTLGCSTHAQRLSAPRSSFFSNQLVSAETQLAKLADKPKGDASVVELDLAMVDLFAGNVQRAEERLRVVRDEWDHLEQKSLAEAATSLLTDDTKRAYHGEDYEKMLIRVLLTLTSLMRDGIDADSYSLQSLEKQQQLVGIAKERWGENISDAYCIPPVAPYLRGVVREQTLRNYDDAQRAYEQTLALLPDSPTVLADLQRVTNGVHSPRGYGAVYIIAFVGRGPYKEEITEPATQEALFIADQILSAIGEYSVPPTLAPVKIPAIASPGKPFDLVGVEVDGRAVATTLPITDLHTLAVDSYAKKLPDLMARTVARRVIKKGAVYAAKDHFDAGASLASLAFDAAGVLWEATESADTRCWGLLPREIQIVRIEMPVGTHQLHLEPITAGRPVAQGANCTVNVLDARNSFVLSYWPSVTPVGQVLVNTP